MGHRKSLRGHRSRGYGHHSNFRPRHHYRGHVGHVGYRGYGPWAYYTRYYSPALTPYAYGAPQQLNITVKTEEEDSDPKEVNPEQELKGASDDKKDKDDGIFTPKWVVPTIGSIIAILVIALLIALIVWVVRRARTPAGYVRI